MTLEQLRALLAQIQSDPAAATDEQLAEARAAIQAQVDAARGAAPSAELRETLTELAAVKAAVAAEQEGRATAAAELAEEMQRLMDGLEEADSPPVAEPADAGDGDDEPSADNSEPPAADAPAETPELAAVAASLAQVASALEAFAPKAPAQAARPAGRTGRPAPAQATPPAPARDAVKLRVRAAGSGGKYTHGQDIASTAELGQAMADRLRGAYQGRGGDGERLFVARVDTEYPDSRALSKNDLEANMGKIEAATAPRALVAAGGLCAPLETLYDVEVIGSAARPFRDALARFGVDRGGIQFRPNTSAAASVFGAGVWTMAQDEAQTDTKGCFRVECPGVENALVEAVYSCLEFSNISSRFDPETTAANVQQGMIAHARLAESRLIAAVAAGSKILSAPKVVGAVRDILANLDKAVAYYRNRHRLADNAPLTFVQPAWVRDLIRADLTRQLPAGDWMEALAVTDQQMDAWFARRNVNPVWHLDGSAGTAEVQTVTITGTPTGGTFTLTYAGETTAPIAFNATAAAVKTALEALTNIDVGDVATAGGPLPGTAVTVTFSGGEAGNVAQMTASSAGLTGGTTPTVTVTTTTAGGAATTVSGVSIAGQSYSDAAAGGVLPGFPDQIDSLLFASGTWLFLDGGALDLGLVRDSTLNAKNSYRQFSETFEGVADRGVESLRIVMTVQPTGQAAGTADTTSAIAD